jgi:hypothetical protein
MGERNVPGAFPHRADLTCAKVRTAWVSHAGACAVKTDSGHSCADSARSVSPAAAAWLSWHCASFSNRLYHASAGLPSAWARGRRVSGGGGGKTDQAGKTTAIPPHQLEQTVGAQMVERVGQVGSSHTLIDGAKHRAQKRGRHCMGRHFFTSFSQKHWLQQASKNYFEAKDKQVNLFHMKKNHTTT